MGKKTAEPGERFETVIANKLVECPPCEMNGEEVVAALGWSRQRLEATEAAAEAAMEITKPIAAFDKDLIFGTPGDTEREIVLLRAVTELLGIGTEITAKYAAAVEKHNRLLDAAMACIKDREAAKTTPFFDLLRRDWPAPVPSGPCNRARAMNKLSNAALKMAVNAAIKTHHSTPVITPTLIAQTAQEALGADAADDFDRLELIAELEFHRRFGRGAP
jgi:hypothetical protein